MSASCPARSDSAATDLRSPLGDRDFRLLLVGTTAVFLGYALLLSVVPLWVVRNGAGELAAGGSTGVFMTTTVLGQLGVPALVRAWGYRAVTVLGALLLAIPAVALIVSTQWPAVLGICALRGIGFGFVTVCGSAMIAELLPRRMLARGSGVYGIAVGSPQLVGLPLATWAAQHWGFVLVFVVAAVLPLLGIAPIMLLPRMSSSSSDEAGRLASTVEKTWQPWSVMLSVSIGFGSLATFLPIVLADSPSAASLALLAVTGTALLARWLAGLLGDRSVGVGRMLPLALLVATVGLGAFAFSNTLGASVPAVLAISAVAVFGLGFGVVQNDSLIVMFTRTASDKASVAWNIAFDAGQGAGAVVVGAVVSGTSFAVAFGLLAVLAGVLLPVAWRCRGNH